MSSQSSHHPQEVPLAQFSLYVHKGGLKPDSFHFFFNTWKTARVIPFYKKGSTDEINNYRPISILPVVSKILEKHVSSTFYTFLNEHNLLNPEQSGFRTQHSCQTALTLMTDDWLNAMHKGKLTGVLMIDLCKDIDLVDHSLLLRKLKIYWCSENDPTWFILFIWTYSKSWHK